MLAAFCLLAALPGWTELRYDRSAIAAGEFWRLATGHFAHLGPAHFSLNTVGLVLVWFLVGSAWNATRWLFIITLSIASIDTGFWLLDPGLAWYVGMSGLLHGVLAAGILGHVRSLSPELVVLGVLFIGKIVYEQVAGPLPGSQESVEGPVVVNAHLYGGVAGAVAALLLHCAGAGGEKFR